MAFPRSVPSLSVDEAAQFRQEMDNFEPPKGMERDLERHREAIRRDG